MASNVQFWMQSINDENMTGHNFTFMLGVVADPVALAKYRLWSIDRNDKSRC